MKKGNINLKDRIKDIKIKENIYLFVIYLVFLFKFICLDFGILKNIEPPIYTYSVYSNNYGFIKFVRWANFVVTIIIVFFLTLTFRFKENKPGKVANQEKRKITKRIFSVSMSFVVTCTLIMVNIFADTYLGILYELVEYSNECYLYEIAERVGDSYAALRDNGVDKKEWEKTYNTLCEGTFIDSWNEPYDTMGFIIDTYLRGEGIKDIANKLSLFDNPKVYVKIIGNKVTAQLYYGKNCEKDKYMYCEYEIPNEIE